MVEHIAAAELPEAEIKELSQLFVDAQDRAQRLEQRVRKERFGAATARPELMHRPRLAVDSATALSANLQELRSELHEINRAVNAVTDVTEVPHDQRQADQAI